MTRTVWLGLLLALPSAALVTPAFGQAKSAPAKADDVSPRQKRATARLVAEFRRTQAKSRRAAIVRQLFALGKPGARALLDEINARLEDALGRYEDAFAKRAAIVAKSRKKQHDPDEVQRLRLRVLGLRKRPDLTKEMIVREADPALAKLRSLLALDRREVLSGAPKSMIALRKRVQGLGQYHDQCTRQLAGPKMRPSPPRNRRRRRRRPKPLPGFEDFLRDREQIAAQVAGAGNPAMAKIVAANSKVAARLGPEEARNVLLCNLTRHLLGLRPLAIDLKLAAAARDHSRDMQRLKFFSHTSPIPEKRRFSDRAARFGTRAISENIYMGRADGRMAHDGWFHSPGHHRNMLGRHTRIGVGRGGVYFTQLFGR